MSENIKDKLEKIDKEHFSLLIDIGKVAKEENLKAYLVGGMVRDILLRFNNLDMDIVVEANASKLATALVNKFPNCELSAKHDRFHTAKVIFTINGKKIPVDLASTREEVYEYPAALPKVNVSDLQKDLYRRDFTINALAVSLLPESFGEIVDLFNGLPDLKNKKIKILHDLSFIDDPTRIIRAVRFGAKLGFEIEAHTKQLLDQAIDSRRFDNLIKKIRGDRVKIEIRYLFNLLNISQVLKDFFQFGIYRMISTKLEPCHTTTLINTSETNSIKQWLIYIAFIIKDLDKETQEETLKNLQLTGEEIKIINNGLSAHKDLSTLILANKEINSVTIYKELKELAMESILITKLLFSSNKILLSLIDDYILNTSHIKLNITGQDLISMGIKEGKTIGRILNKILEVKIERPNMSQEDEILEAKKISTSTTNETEY